MNEERVIVNWLAQPSARPASDLLQALADAGYVVIAKDELEAADALADEVMVRADIYTPQSLLDAADAYFRSRGQR